MCRTCRDILRWYGHGGVGYLHVHVGGPSRGKFFMTDHPVPEDQRHNPRKDHRQ
jgi:hypothetical protein